METTRHPAPPDHLLLERWFSAGDGDAFTELVRRHLPLVCAAALRVTGNRALAEDASQRVFSRLARLRAAPPVNLPLPVWLHRAARSAAIDLVRAESRRRRREQIFASSHAMDTSPFPWERIAPVLDEVIDRLPAGERGLILRRFLSGESFAAIAADLRLSEDAARMRVNRAVEKLRELLERRGVRTTAAALATELPAHAVPVSAGLVTSVSAAALSAAASAAPAVTGLSATLMTSKATALSVSAIIILTGGGMLLWQASAPAPQGGPPHSPLQTVRSSTAVPGALSDTKKPLPEWGTPEFGKMVLERGAKWLESRGRDSAGLVALWDLSGEESLLLEAAKRFPDDPRVCAAMIGHLTMKGKDALPWAERLIKNEPDNPAGHYWKATLLAEAKKPEEALKALKAGTEVEGTPDQHLRERIVNTREAVLAGGGSVKEAAQSALMGPFSKTGQPLLGGKINSVLREAIAGAKASGNEDGLVETAGMAAAAAEHMRFADASSLMNDLVTQGMLLMALKELPPETEYGDGGKTAGERLAEIETERARTRELMGSHKERDNFMAELTDGQMSEYTDRVILRGERAAMRWLNELINESGAGPDEGP